MIKPQGPSGPGREAARGDIPPTKISSYDAKNKSQKQPTNIPKRPNDAGKAQGYIVAEKTIRRGRGSSGAKRPQRSGNPGDSGAGEVAGEDAGEDEVEEEEAQHPEVPRPPRDPGG